MTPLAYAALGLLAYLVVGGLTLLAIFPLLRAAAVADEQHPHPSGAAPTGASGTGTNSPTK